VLAATAINKLNSFEGLIGKISNIRPMSHIYGLVDPSCDSLFRIIINSNFDINNSHSNSRENRGSKAEIKFLRLGILINAIYTKGNFKFTSTRQMNIYSKCAPNAFSKRVPCSWVATYIFGERRSL
jgi:hypothetical protein